MQLFLFFVLISASFWQLKRRRTALTTEMESKVCQIRSQLRKSRLKAIATSVITVVTGVTVVTVEEIGAVTNPPDGAALTTAGAEEWAAEWAAAWAWVWAWAWEWVAAWAWAVEAGDDAALGILLISDCF
ncbi:hypothetical protein GPALN_005166 [Globodera pallida]|nr:hypothetical protein GPALN_005166 [Globodera pallida]